MPAVAQRSYFTHNPAAVNSNGTAVQSFQQVARIAMSTFIRGGRVLLAGLLPTIGPGGDDIIDKKNNKTYQAYLEQKPPSGSGWERLQQMFTIDEFGAISSELNSIYQAGFLGFLIGAIYGGVTQSRVAYMNFMENNQASTFASHLDAKRKLQDQFTVNFAKGGVRWGWRVGLFTMSYYGIITGISVYRDKSSIYEYLAAGSVTGALYKVNLGLRGMTAGGIIGCALGAVAGGTSLLIMRASGTSMEEVRYWQYKWRMNRDQLVQEAFKAQVEKDETPSELVKSHDARVGDKVSLDSIK